MKHRNDHPTKKYMNKILKIVIILISIFVGIILIDTLQAVIFKRSPLISQKEKLIDTDSWVDRGIIIDTFYCTKEKDMITVKWLFKKSKYTCPVDNISIEELTKLQEEILNKLEEKKNYKNVASIHIEEEKQIIVIELVENTNKEQTWFRNNISDSELIIFKQGGPYTTSDSLDFYIIKEETNTDKKYKEYYSSNERKIYLSNNIKEFYIVNNKKRLTLNKYISLVYQTLEDSIKSLTSQLENTIIYRDGGTKVYKSKEKDITIITCNKINGNKDIYIGDYKMNYEDNMCK